MSGTTAQDLDLIEQLKQDYARFPADQTYSLYAENVQFKDPLNAFEGIERYRQMIDFLARFFSDIQMDLQAIDTHTADARTVIKTQWVLHMNAPLPWSPRLSIPGHSELELNEAGLIASHIDDWSCSRLAVLMQVFGR